MAVKAPKHRKDPPVSNGQVVAESRSATSQTVAPLDASSYLVDREISSSESDAFGHRHFALVLRSLVESDKHQPPYSIGLLGPWGTGKTSIKSLYLKGLAGDQSKVDGRKRRDRVRAITFNAWRFGGGDIKRALLREVYRDLGGKETVLDDLLFHQHQRPMLERESNADLIKGLVNSAAWVLQAAVFAVVAFAIGKLLQHGFGLAGSWATVSGLVLTTVAALFASASSTVQSLMVTPFQQVLKIELPRTSAEQYEDLIVKQLRHFKNANKHCERLIVFVDDLDRLSAEEMVSGLDAVRTFMELSPAIIPDEFGVVFVISCDEDRVAAALADRRRKGSADLPGAIESRTDARRYLDRIFQFRLEIPPFPSQDMRSFAKLRLAEAMPDIANQLGASPLDDVVDRMIHVGVQDPRKAIQIVNAFAQCWRLAKQRELEGPGSQRAGGLEPGAVTKYPEALAALAGLRVSFPDFYLHLEQDPGLLQGFIDYFVRGTREGIPERALIVLQKYELDPPKPVLKDSPAPQIQNDFRTLRQFISGVQWIQWPRSLQPLLLLSQDRLTRGNGDRALAVSDALVSAEPQGVLEALGRHLDSRTFSVEEVQLVRAVLAGLENENDLRQDNAAAAIAGLATRIPSEVAATLLTPVARRLIASQRLRWRVGFPRISELLPALYAPDRRDLAGKLIADLFPPTGAIQFRTQSDETMSFEEAIALVESAVPVLLTVWAQDDLSASAKAQLTSWLKTRDVRTGQESKGLSFAQLDAWVSDHEDILLPELADDYVLMLSDALEAETDPSVDVAAAAGRSRTTLARLWEANREQFWVLATKLASRRNPQLVDVGWQLANEHIDAADPETASSFVGAFADRLVKEESGGDDWGLTDWRTASATLVRQVERKEAALTEACWDSLGALAAQWGDHDETQGFGITVVEKLRAKRPQAATAAVEHWISILTKDLAPDCARWIGRGFGDKLTAQQRTTALETMKSTLGEQELTEEQARQLQLVVEGLVQPAALLEEALELAQNALAHLNSFYTTQEYVLRVLPVVAPLIPRIPVETIGPPLLTFAVNVEQVPALVGPLHEHLRGRWPAPESGGAYSPKRIFDFAVGSVDQWRSDDDAEHILRSVADMVRDGVVPEDRIADVLTAAHAVWANDPSLAADVICSFPASLTPDEAAALGKRTNVEEPDRLEALSRTWAHTAAMYDEAELLEVTKAILIEAPRGTSEQPDLILSRWLDALGNRLVGHLHALLADAELTDERQARVWVQVAGNVETLSAEGLTTLLEVAFSPDVEDQSLRALQDSWTVFQSQFRRDTQRYALMKQLLRLFIASNRAEAQHLLAQWLRDIGMDSVFGDEEGTQEISADQVQLLEQYFPNNRHLRKLAKQIGEGDDTG